jgi:hypothetical protein
MESSAAGRLELDQAQPSSQTGGDSGFHEQPRDATADPTTPSLAELNLLRELRTEAQGLKEVLDLARKGEYGLHDQLAYIKHTREDITKLIARLEQSNEQRERDQKPKSDSICAIVNHWEQAEPLLRQLFTDASEKAESHLMLRRMSDVDRALCFIIAMVGERTIGERLNTWLDRNEPGDVVSFHRLFEDELPNPADRQRVLGLLAARPLQIKRGLLDPLTGLVYRYPDTWQGQVWRLAMIVFTFALCFGGLVGYLVLIKDDPEIAAPGLPFSGLVKLFVGAWIMLLIGMGVHAMISRRKSIGGDVIDHRVPVTRWTCYITARTGMVLGTLCTSIAAMIAYQQMKGELPSWDEAFLLGYGFDSFVELLSAEMGRRSSERVAGLATTTKGA